MARCFRQLCVKFTKFVYSLILLTLFSFTMQFLSHSSFGKTHQLRTSFKVFYTLCCSGSSNISGIAVTRLFNVHFHCAFIFVERKPDHVTRNIVGCSQCSRPLDGAHACKMNCAVVECLESVKFRYPRSLHIKGKYMPNCIYGYWVVVMNRRARFSMQLIKMYEAYLVCIVYVPRMSNFSGFVCR